MDKRIWLSAPHMSGDEQKFIEQAFQENYITTLGSNVTKFEQGLEDYFTPNRYVTTLNSGTSAIHLALKLIGVTQGDEVLCQSFTFVGSINPVLYLKATPVFVDSEESTWNLSPELLEKAILDRLDQGKKPKAIIAVHLFGMPYQVEKINEISEKYDIPVIEDAAESLGSFYKDKPCGGLSDYSILSFNGNKIITTSGGGGLITTSKQNKEQAIYWATQSKADVSHYEHTEVGYNYRLSNVLAGIGRGQLNVLSERVNQRRAIYDYYKSELESIDQVFFLDEPKGAFSNRWLSCILFKDSKIRDEVKNKLEENNIESRFLWKPMHMQPLFKDNISYHSGVSEKLFERGLCLPSSSFLKQEDLARVVSIIKFALHGE